MKTQILKPLKIRVNNVKIEELKSKIDLFTSKLKVQTNEDLLLLLYFYILFCTLHSILLCFYEPGTECFISLCI